MASQTRPVLSPATEVAAEVVASVAEAAATTALVAEATEGTSTAEAVPPTEGATSIKFPSMDTREKNR